MTVLRFTGFLLVLSLALLAGLMPALAEMSGSRGQATVFTNWDRRSIGAEPPYVVKTEIDPVAWMLNSVEGKYRTVKFTVDNREQPRDLSSAEDTIEMVYKDGGRDVTVPGILRMQQADSAFWDSLPASIREDIVYPRSIKANSVVHFFVFFPKDKVAGMPASFQWKVRSLQKPISMVVPQVELK